MHNEFPRVYEILECEDSLVFELIQDSDLELLIGNESFGNFADDKGDQPS